MHFIGIDIGTTSVCGVVYDFINQTTDSISVDNSSWISSSNTWERIQDPEKIIGIVIQIINGFETKYDDIKGIGITGQMHGILYVDKDGNSVSPLITWLDERGTLEFNSDFTYAEYLINRTKHKLATGFGLVTHFYNCDNGLVPKNASKICTIMDFAVMKLANRKTPLIDNTNAAGLGFFNVKENTYDVGSIKSIGMDTSILPDINESGVVAGYYNNSIPVYSAIGDNQASFIGSVTDRNKSIHVTIGTSSQISVYSSFFLEVDSIDTRPFPWGGYILVGAALSGGQSLAVLEKFFNSVLQLSKGNMSSFANFYEVINAIDYRKDDDDAVVVKTLFNGSRVDPLTRGSISNISSVNFTAAELIVGFMKGICKEVLEFYNAMPNELKINKKVLTGSGNAIKKNDLVCKILNNTFNLEVVKSKYDEDAAFGACILALIGGNFISGLDSLISKSN
jgi:sedoheptulokinase